ncbi:SOS response-associated peptidase [Bacillus weihaiensis]|uniref:Abasic site processing protein n=1 Tax=Bacillus weihaiensis TaxID=1547283 RepID=A0A1L3MR63_9BACI|nr:SOS response-associated peptidase [Bacillus weihaiensis]APH04811.1 hypothetical protein A9C19_08660 [Bacillus weihaiensis]
MCGRFSLATDQEILQEEFNFRLDDEMYERYNIAPSQNILVVGSNRKERIGVYMKWGLIPPWAKDAKIGYKMINARAETIDEKSSFKKPFLSQRCLILSDGFFEWKKDGTKKEPIRFVMKNRKPFAMAGLWEKWNDGGKPLFSCTIITTTANEITEDVHDRMPVILPKQCQDLWLDRDYHDIHSLKSFLVPYHSNAMERFTVSSSVNSPKNDTAECLEPLNSL